MLEIGMSSSSFILDEETFAGLNAAGIKNTEVSGGYSRLLEYDLVKICSLSQKYGVRLWSTHLPFGDPQTLDIASLDEDIRRKTVDCWKDFIKRFSDIGVARFIAHPSSEPKSEEEGVRAEELKRSMESLCSLAETADRCGAVIAVEDLPRSCLGRNSDELLKLVSADERLRICFDTNHLLGEDPIKFIERVAHKIITLHVSDYDFINERHWLPGEGKLDWLSIYKNLTELGYGGVWMYEVGLGCPNTIIRDRRLTFEDFARNANEIFEGKAPTAIGTPKENLGMWA